MWAPRQLSTIALVLALGLGQGAAAADQATGAGGRRVIDVDTITVLSKHVRVAEVRRLSPTGQVLSTDKVQFDCRARRYEIVWRLSGAPGEQTTTMGFASQRPKAGSPEARELDVACRAKRP